MARIRTIKPEFWLNEELSLISESACLLAIGLMNYSDDEGFFNANPLLIKAAVFPIRETSGTVPVLLQELYKCGYIDLFLGNDGKKYGKIVNFGKHQVINKPKPSKIKELGLIPYQYGTENVTLPPGKERKGKDQGKEERDHIARDQPVDNSGADNPERFCMHPDWKPLPGFAERAAGWGQNLDQLTPYTAPQLRQFCDYWIPEDTQRFQEQWEMTFAKSLEHQAIKKFNET
ncbi:DnaT-like ssDNA-binding domain-containing protein [Klebsiella aerogenes]|uniref:DnaT-like ssDNA-binding domain-containing protein n=1 Tax=Klebsiella aerogenes TaxID=548 RepID=UPI001BCD2D42|nr:DnaT-like ssDNA-binding domain-containing protein [Klebsiella aerogenes]